MIQDSQSVPKLPSDFKSRGWSVPFTTPILTFARLRRTAEEKFEYLIPGLAGGGETYVIPASLLNDIGQLSVHDRTLLEDIADLRDLSPTTLRRTVNKIAASGLAGPDAGKKSRKAISREVEDRIQIHVLLIQKAVEELGDGRDAPTIAELATAEGRDVARDAIRSYADEASLTPDAIFSMLEIWAGLVTAYGSPNKTVKGPLADLMEEMQELGVSLLKWLAPEPQRPAQMAQRIAAASKETLKEAMTVDAQLTERFENMADTLSRWEDARVELASLILKLDAILDGWRRIVDRWRSVENGDRVDQRDVVEKCALSVPILPADLVGRHAEFWLSLRQNQVSWSEEAKSLVPSGLEERLKKKLSEFKTESV